MKIKLIDFGVPEHQRPYRPHGNDAGAGKLRSTFTIKYPPCSLTLPLIFDILS